MANYIKGTKIQENSISETKLDSSLQSWKETVTNHINNNDNPHNITKSSIGLDNVTNDAQVKRSELGVANGVATLDSTGKVPSGQLPSYVDDVIEGYLYNGVFYKDTSYTTSIVGESGKIYIDLPTNKTYRWTGSVYGVISETIALGELSSTAYRGDRGKIAYDHSQSAHAPSNAQANVIETIKVNGTALTPNSKAVDITIPTVGNGTITIKQGGTSKGTFTTNQNGNTTIELTDTNTTYTAGDGLSLSGTTFSNNGVRSIATGTTNGTISVNTNGNISNIGVYGLKSAAYTNSSDYATASHTHSYLPLSGGTMSNTNVVTNLNADLLDGYHASSFSKTKIIDLPVGQVLRISMEDRRGFLISMQGPNAGRNALYFVTGYGIGTTLRNDIRVIKGGPYNLYFNGTSEAGCVYIVGTSSFADTTDFIYINPFDSDDIVYSIVSSVPSDAVLVSSSNSNILASLNSNVASSSKWETARTITLTGSVTGSVSIDGSANVTLATTTNHTHNYLPLSGGTITNSSVARVSFESGSTTGGIYGAPDNKVAIYINGSNYPELFISAGVDHPVFRYASQNYAILHSGNFNSYSPKLDGTGASGTWGINISGNAATATKLANSRTIWGQSFDGTGNVSGALGMDGIEILDKKSNSLYIGYGSAVNSGLPTYLWGKGINFINSGGKTKMLVTDEGNVGIDTTSPSYKLHVVGNGYFTENVITESDFSSRGNAIIDGRVGIGTSSPAYNLDVDGNMRITGPIRLNVPNSNEKYYISTEYNGLLGITYEGRYQNPAFLMNNLGYVYLNCENPVSPAYPLVVNGTISCTTLSQTSDIKYKTNIKQIEYEEALKIIENLNPVTWDWNENTVETGSSSGFVAQEAEEFIPNAISRDNENNLSLDYTQLHSYEIRVIQEQQKEIKDLKQRLEVLESLVLQLTNREI